MAIKNLRYHRQFWQKPQFSWSSWLWRVVVLVFAAVISLRLFILQWQNTLDYQARAEQNRTWKVTERAPRGEIFDRNGVLVAGNDLRFTLLVEKDDKLVESPLPTELAMAYLATQSARVRLNYSRIYPFGPVLSHIIGYVQSPQTGDDLVFGRTGVERTRNDQLVGQDGWRLYERNARGEPVRLLSQRYSEKGQNINLTIDAQLSEVAFKALGDHTGTVIVSNPKNGQILSMVSKPSYIPVVKNQIDLEQAWQAEIEAGQVAPSIQAALNFANNPFLLRAIGAVYPPGSVFKIVTALAALEYEALDENTMVLDEGFIEVNDYEYANWYWRQYGRTEGEINLVRSIARSNDIFFYKAAEWVGPKRLAEFARILSLGTKTGINLPGEQAGLIPDPAWKQEHFGEPWYLGNTYHFGIGQGDVLVTPIQINDVMGAVVNRGRLCSPTIFLDSAAVCQELSLAEESLALVKQGLSQACSSGGTAYPFFDFDRQVWCKTGTAEFGGADEQGYRPTHGWFVAAINDQPRNLNTDTIGEDSSSEIESTADIVITVMVESGEQQKFVEGSQEAAPIAREIADWWLENRSQE